MSADFTPVKEDLKILTPFKMQVLTNFPYIEADFDALTNYQLLCKVVEYLNNVIAESNEVTEQVLSLYNAYVELQTYVNNYFDSLDVQEAIDEKIDELVEDGTISNIIRQYLKTFDLYISNYPKENNEEDDTGRLQRAVNDAISKKNANLVIDEVLHISDTIDIDIIDGYEQLTISGNNENTALNNMFYNSTWNPLVNGIYATNDINVFEIHAPEAHTDNELKGIKFSKLAIVNNSYVRPDSGSDVFADTMNGIVYERASIVVEHCFFYGMNNGIYNAYTADAYSDMVIINDCDFQYYINSAITLSRADSGLIQNCGFVPFNLHHNAIYIRGSRAVKLLDNTYSNWGHFVSGEWVRATANATTENEEGSYFLFCYDSEASVDCLHIENHNGTAIIYSKNSNIKVNNLTNPLCCCKVMCIQYRGVVGLSNSTIKYIDGYSPWTDISSINGNFTIDNCYRYDASTYYPLKISQANASSLGAVYPVCVQRLRITNDKKLYITSPYDAGNGFEVTLNQYGEITFELPTTIGKMVFVSIGYGNYSKATAVVDSKVVKIKLYDSTGTIITDTANLIEGNVSVMIV